MPFLPGRAKTGGRKSGTLNHADQPIAERLRAMGCNPFQVLADLAAGDLPCGVCRGEGKTRYQAKSDRLHERKCESCYGSGKERISPSERARAASELAQYLEPKRKAIELTGPQGGPVLTKIEVVLVDAREGRRLEPGGE